jgi:hypothetical protein
MLNIDYPAVGNSTASTKILTSFVNGAVREEVTSQKQIETKKE